MESWCFSAPELLSRGISVDLGLLAEALIYYDHVAANITTQPQFAEFLQWFIRQGRLTDLVRLVRDGAVRIYDYAFATIAGQVGDGYRVLNIQDPVQAQPNSFPRRFLDHESVRAVLEGVPGREGLREALQGNVIEVKAADFGKPVKNATDDYHDSRRNGLIMQALLDELYRMRSLGRAPIVEAEVRKISGTPQYGITWNVSLEELTELAGENLRFHPGLPLTAAANANRLIWSAAQLSCDLYVPRPMSLLVGDKLYESARRAGRAGEVIQELKAQVEFPDIRELVNRGRLELDEILAIRKKAHKFRSWLQQESDRDRDAIIAYHNEVARELGSVRGARKALSMFGILGGPVVGSIIGCEVAGPLGTVIGAAAGAGTTYLAEVAARLAADWRPVVFGTWLKDRIQRAIGEAE